jgi:hypothetical protein
VIFSPFGASNGLRPIFRPKAVLDISPSRNLYFLTIVEGVNCYKEARSAGTAKKETLIFGSRMALLTPLRNTIQGAPRLWESR